MSSVLKWIRFPQLRKILNWRIIPPGFNVAEHRLLPSISMLTLAKASSPGIFFWWNPSLFTQLFVVSQCFLFSGANSPAGTVWQLISHRNWRRRGLRGLRGLRTEDSEDSGENSVQRFSNTIQWKWRQHRRRWSEFAKCKLSYHQYQWSMARLPKSAIFREK